MKDWIEVERGCVDAKSRRRKRQGLEKDLRKAIAYLRIVSVVLGSLQLLPRQVMQ